MKRITELAGRFSKQDVWVLGAGPSLNEVPDDVIPLERAIACNSAIEVKPAKYVIMVDPNIWDNYARRVTALGSYLIASDNIYWPLVRGHFDEDMVYTFGFRTSYAPGMGVNGVLHKGRITGYYAAEIAAMMAGDGGTVILTGMDLEYPKSGPTHAAHASGVKDGSSDHPFFDGLRALARLRDALSGRVAFRVVGRSALLSHGFEAL